MSQHPLDLYQDLVLDHHRNPRHYEEPIEATHRAERKNRVCGDVIGMAFRLQDNTLQQVAFTGEGCAIARASASLLTTKLLGLAQADANQLLTRLDRALTTEHADPHQLAAELRLLINGVRQHPARLGCARLAVETAIAALPRA